MRILAVMHSPVTRTILRRRLLALGVDLVLDFAEGDAVDARVAARAGSVDLVIVDARDAAATRALLADLRSLAPELMLAVALWRPDGDVEAVADAAGAVRVYAPFDPDALRVLLARAVALRAATYDDDVADSPYDDPPRSFLS